jgi:carbonic anhydrase
MCDLFESNRAWAKKVSENDPTFFKRLSGQQNPQYLWIGCSDSRVPANEIVGLEPGQLFVHRNVANVVVHSDLNCLSVMQYAVDVLKVRHIIVTGHYGCGGIRAALSNQKMGLIDNWLRHVQDVAAKHKKELDSLSVPLDQENRLCELNVIEQVYNVCLTTVVQQAWDRNQELTIHGWIYGLKDGLLRDLGISASSSTDLRDHYERLFPSRT